MVEVLSAGGGVIYQPCIILANIESRRDPRISVVPLSAAPNEFSSQNVYVKSSEIPQKIAPCAYCFSIDKTKIKGDPLCRLSSSDLNEVGLGVLGENSDIRP
ncbi:MAG: hypothetical protein KGM15_15710 [Pseudomonadota bacterium]|nr:hypothetical protein [Pseudomonadota bacterium]